MVVNQGGSNINRIKRILREIAQCSKEPHSQIHFFPCESDIGFWHIILEGPIYTPYEDSTFLLYAEFPSEYPNKAPELRFITPIYHCNINKNGRICHSIFDRNYTITTTMKDIFSYIYGLLMTPEADDPLDNSMAAEFFASRSNYEAKARQEAQNHAHVPLKERLRQLSQSITGEESKEGYPPWCIDPLTHQPMEDPVLVKPTQVSYDRKSITQHILQHGTDPVMNKPLRIADLVPNPQLKKEIIQFKTGAHWFNQ